VIVGCVRVALGQDLRDAQFWFARGEVAMQQGPFDDLAEYAAQVNPSLLGVFPVPAGPGPGGRPVVGVFRHFTAMSEGVGRRPKRERDAVWKVLTALTSPEARDENIRRRVLNGHACFVDPADLRRLGYADYIPEVPASLRRLYEGLEDGAILARTEPFVGHSTAVFMALNANVLSPMLAASGEGFDYRRALADEEHAANTGVLVERPRETLAPYRPLAWAVLAVAALAMGFLVTRIIRHELGKSAAGTGASRAGVYRPWLPWLMLAPALGSVALWGYYPLLRGMVMAFQDYRIVGHSPWVGLDNFITVFQNPDFYIHVRQTLKFVALNLLLVFTAPILLSLLLSEIPRGKVFWRSVFSLPQLTSGLVIVLLWKLMYSPAETGLLNRVVALFGGKARDWLGDPRTAMLAVIVPSVWAGMGISSLIYLAALKCVPDELYEAATLDGAGVRRKLWSITLPQLMPLILINFVGAFIGTFQSMGSILLLTFGGPGKETMVLSMAIWMEAYTNLRFSTATAMAWILGSALIGFAYLQIRMLRRVEFRRVEEV
jgi:multiple sugar transport system permease protein